MDRKYRNHEAYRRCVIGISCLHVVQVLSYHWIRSAVGLVTRYLMTLKGKTKKAQPATPSGSASVKAVHGKPGYFNFRNVAEMLHQKRHMVRLSSASCQKLVSSRGSARPQRAGNQHTPAHTTSKTYCGIPEMPSVVGMDFLRACFPEPMVATYELVRSRPSTHKKRKQGATI